MEKWDRERHIQFDQGVPVKLPNNKFFFKKRAAFELTNKTPRRFHDLVYLLLFFESYMHYDYLSKKSSEPFCAQVNRSTKAFGQ